MPIIIIAIDLKFPGFSAPRNKKILVPMRLLEAGSLIPFATSDLCKANVRKKDDVTLGKSSQEKISSIFRMPVFGVFLTDLYIK